MQQPRWYLYSLKEKDCGLRIPQFQFSRNFACVQLLNTSALDKNQVTNPKITTLKQLV